MRYNFFHKGKRKSYHEDGITFDSSGELARYQVLKVAQTIGHIQNLEVHPEYIIQDAFTDAMGVKQSKIIFTPDFRYVETAPSMCESRTIIEDVKPLISYRTKKKRIKKTKFLTNDRYPLIKKLFLKIHLKPGQIYQEIEA